MNYYTSDLHFGHKNIIQYENRPFNSTEDMTIGLILNWNEIVKPDDDVYILGDFAFQNSYMTCGVINDILRRLNGKKHLIVGNHDSYVNKQAFNPRYFEEITPYKEIKDSGNFIVLCHYPIESWNCKRYGGIHLHGHTHINDSKPDMNRYNVGCMLYNYKPVTLKQILDANKQEGEKHAE